MPVSIVLHLGLASKIKPQRDVGRHIHGWFFHTLSERYSKDFATLLHGSNTYTLSGLFPQPARYPGNYYVRITSVDEQVCEFLLHEFSNKVPSILRFGVHVFDLEGIAIDKHPMAKQSSFHNLSSESGNGREIFFHFASPTSFHSQEIYIPLPIPFHVFNSLLGKWNDHAPQPLVIKNRKEFQEFVAENVSVTEMDGIHTSSWSLPKGGWDSTIGFEGTVRYTILRRSKIEKRLERVEKRLHDLDGTDQKYKKLVNEKQKNEEWLLHFKEYCSQLNCLANFSFFCGVGHHTAEGMGQSRILPQAPQKS